MRSFTPPRLGLLALAVLAGLLTLVPAAAAATFPNNAAITIADCCEPQEASPSPAAVTVSGMGTSTTNVTATVTLMHGDLADVDLLLVAPTGQKVLLLSDSGLSAAGESVTFNDAALGTVPLAAPLAPGTYKPTDVAEDCTGMPASDSFPGAPPGAITTTLSSFNGVDPNGTWNLYAVDDCEVDSGSLPTGITLNISTGGGPTSFPSGGAVSLGDCCDATAAGTYPSQITASGQTGSINGLSVTLKGLTHNYGADLNAILQGPGGESVLLMSDAGRVASGVDITFSDAGGTPLPATANLTAGIYTPTNLAEECGTGGAADPFPGAAPASPGSALSVFNNTTPNGVWKLWLVDDCGGDAGQLASGWELNVATGPTAVSVSRFGAAHASKGVTLRWRTAQETQLLGFNVYRAREGKRIKLNKALIAAKSKPAGASYSFLDRKAPRGQTVLYRLQAVGIDGKRSWHGSARVAPAKAGPAVSFGFLGPQAPTAELTVVCALEKNGSLRYVTNASQCRKKEDAVTLAPGPIHTCYQADGSIRRVASAACPGSGTYLALPPQNADEHFCADADGRLRRVASPGCGGGETAHISSASNHAPTDIALSNNTIAENAGANAVVGTFSTSDPEGGSHTYTLVSGTGSTDNGAFNISGNQLRANASFNFEADSSYDIRIRTTDSGGLFFEEAFTITVTNVNEAPTDIALTSSSIAENQASGTPVGTFSSTDPDASNTHTYSLVAGAGDTDNASFTIVGSELRTAAAFNFETKSSYAIRVRTTDQGSLFFEEQFTITVTNVNEAPVLTVPAAQTVNEDTDLNLTGGSQLSVSDPDGNVNVKLSLDVGATSGTLTLASVAGLTFVDGTANGTASLHFTGTVSAINTALGGLKYRGTQHWNSTRGTEALQVVVNDQGNTGSGGALSDSDSVGVTVNAVNDAPVAALKNFSVQTNMKANDLSGLLSGATDPDSGDAGYSASFTLAGVTTAGGTCSGCTVSDVQGTGSFDVDPPGGVATSQTLTYTITDSGNPGPGATSAPATITLNISGPVIWFVDNTNGLDTNKGTLASPFKTITQAATVDGASHRIFVFSAGTTTGAITLNNDEWLIGQQATTAFDTLFGITPPATTIARPTMNTGTTALSGTVTLATNAKLQGLSLSTGASAGIVGSGGISGINVSESSITTTTATALNLNAANGTYSFSSISTNGAATGMQLDALFGGSVIVSGGSIVNASTRGIDINGGTGNVTYNGSISTTATGRSVEITSHSGGTMSFGGQITDSGLGINLDTYVGGTINFTGGLNLSTGGNTAFRSTGGGTLTVTQNNTTIVNTITTTTGTGLSVDGGIGASGLTFRSISVSGAPNGIVLSNTGSAGGLTVVGNGGSCTVATPTCTGGTIQNTTGTAVVLTNTANVAFARLRLLDAAGEGVTGTGVNNFTFDNSLNIGTGDADNEDAFDFGALNSTNITGALSITNSTIRQFSNDGVVVRNISGSLSVTLTNNTFFDNDGTFGVNAVLIESLSNATANLAATSNTFDKIDGPAIQFEAEGTGGTHDVDIIGNTFSHPNANTNFEVGGGVILIADTFSSNPAELTFTVQGNYFNLISGIPINVVGLGNASGRIGGDTPANQNGPGGANQGNGIRQAGGSNGCAEDAIRIDNDGNFNPPNSTVNTTWTILVKNNFADGHNGVDVGGDLCPGASGDQGIVVFNRDHPGTLNVTIDSNTFTDMLNQGLRAFIADRDGAVTNGPNTFLAITNNSFSNITHTDAISMSVDDQADGCANITGNTKSGGGAPDGSFFLDRRVATAVFNVPQASTAAIASANNGATVTLGPVALTFNQACNPPLPP